MFKKIWYRLFHKRAESVPTKTIEELRRFLNLNYISEDAEQAITAPLDDAELSGAYEAEESPWVAEEFYDATFMMPTEDEHPAQNDDSYEEITQEIREYRQASKLSKRRALSSIPSIKKEEPDYVESIHDVKLNQSLDEVISAIGITFCKR